MKYHQIGFFHYLVIMKTGGSLKKSIGLKITSAANGPFEEKDQSGTKIYNYYISMNW